jgi:hypothetical protein
MGVRVADCPLCGSRATPAGGSAYCKLCGWNRSVGDEDIRQRLSSLPFVFLGFVVLSLFTKNWLGIAAISVIGGLFTIASGGKLFLQRKELRRGQNQSGAEPSAPNATVQDIGFVVPARFSHLAGLHAPRRLKMKRVFRWATVLMLFVGLMFTCASYSLIVPPHQAMDDPRWGIRLGLISAAISVALVSACWIERRRKCLLRSGELRFARVVDSDAGRGSLLPGARYKFETGDGKEIEGFDQDWTDSFHPGMVVPVFYDSRNPENHVAMCGSFYDVV